MPTPMTSYTPHLQVTYAHHIDIQTTYFGPNLSGPNNAPRAHMGSPVCRASTHLTATSPNM